MTIRTKIKPLSIIFTEMITRQKYDNVKALLDSIKAWFGAARLCEVKSRGVRLGKVSNRI